MLRIALVALALIFAVGFHPLPAMAANTQFDGVWSLEFDDGCKGTGRFPGGRYEAVIENGAITGQFRNGGAEEILLAEISRNGKIYDGRLGYRKFRGRIDGSSGNGMLSFRQNCLAEWTLTLLEPAQAAPAQQKSSAAATPVADDTPPLINAPGSVQTDGPVVELAGRVDDSSSIIEFTVNGAAAQLQADGSFALRRGVIQGESELIIAALDEWGNRAERRVQVTRSSGEESVLRGTEPTAASAADASAPLIALPPALETSTALIEITGGIVDASTVVDVRVGGRSVALSSDGTFSIRRGVPVGDSELVVTALDEWGNEASKRVRVTRREPAEAPVAEAEAPVEAQQAAAPAQEDRDTLAPRMELPQELVTEAPEIDISGSVSDASTVTDLLINERPVNMRADGSFHTKQSLKIGVNKFAFTAIDEWGNRAEKTIQILRKQLDLDLGDYHALVIGNNDYGDMPKLKTAVADAEAVSQVLEDRYGFSVTKLINATRFDMIGAMGDLRAKLSYDTNLLVYYAGHGIVDPVTERGYWLPVDAHQNNSANWVSNDDITDMLKAIPARHILVIADSCYSGTLVRAAPINLDTWEDRRDWLKRIVEKRSRTALASGGLEPVADAGSGGHSVFAAALLSVLRDNSEIVEAQALFAPVRKSVVLNADQTPVYSDIRLAGHDGGDFIFAPK